MSLADLVEALRAMSSRHGVPMKHEELLLVAKVFVPDDKGVTRPAEVLDYLQDELRRKQWVSVGKRLRTAMQKATLVGRDPEQMLADRDLDGDHYITGKEFKGFLTDLSKYGKLTLADITMAVNHFSRRPNRLQEHQDRDPISLREVMSFLGGEYVGNLPVRMRRVLLGPDPSAPTRPAATLLKVLQSHMDGADGRSGQDELDAMEVGLGYLGVFEELSHDQVRKVLMTAKRRLPKGSRLTPAGLLQHLGIAIPVGSEKSAIKAAPDLESLLRLLIDKTRSMGLAVDDAFRHFDADGDGTITTVELMEGLSKLRIFDGVPNWREKIPELVRKFDKDGNGDVSLREFFRFLGIDDYSPDILQKMTKIFAVASEQGATVEDIFSELDADGDGDMTAEELLQGLRSINFKDITESDASKVIEMFDKDGDKKASMKEFVEYFSGRVDQVLAERANRKLCQKFRDILQAAVAKGLSVESLFAHFDHDGGSSITAAELQAGLSKIPQLKGLKPKEIEALVRILDADGSGDVSLEEFRAFVTVSSATGSANNAVAKLRSVFQIAVTKGLTTEKLFSHFDKDGSGSVNAQELSDGLRKMSHFKDLSASEVAGIVRILDKDADGHISLREFTALLEGSEGGGGGGGGMKKAEEPGEDNAVVSRLRAVMKAASAKGLTIEKIFTHFDKDGSGSVNAQELSDGLRKMSHFKDLSASEVASIVRILDKDGDGHISLREFAALLEGSYTSSSIKAGESKEGVATSSKVDTVVNRFRAVVRSANEKGLSTESIFRYFDKDKSGVISTSELMMGLRKLEHFKELSASDARAVVSLLDKDGSGDVSMDEFRYFVLHGSLMETKAKSTKAPATELFIRHMRRIAEPDGGMAGLLAYLDDDEDGLIALSKLMRLLKREDVFDSLPESDVLTVLEPFFDESKEQLRVVKLLRFLEGGASDDRKDEEEDEAPMEYEADPEPEYEFSRDPELRSLEKKLRSVGRALARKGVDVEHMFHEYDAQDSGCVRRTEFVEALSRLGMYLLEQGKVLESAGDLEGGEVDSLRRQQLRQVRRLRGEESYAENAARAARKLVMGGPRDQDAGEFKVERMKVELFIFIGTLYYC